MEKVIIYKSNKDRTVDESEFTKILDAVEDDTNVTLVDISENPFGFFNYLKITKGTSQIERISSVNYEPEIIKPPRYYDLMSFRIYLCELVYNAINLFPEIYEYTITTKNENGTSTLTFGLFKELSDDGHPAMGIIKSSIHDETFFLTINHIKALYMANRHSEGVNHLVVTSVIVSMFMCGSIPSISLDYKINTKHFKNVLKFK